MPSTVVPRNGGFGARATIAGHQTWLGTYPTREEAEHAVKRAKASAKRVVNGRRAFPETVRGWSEQWTALYPGQRSEETARHNAQMLAPFVRRYGTRLLCTFTPFEAQAWAVSSPGSVRYLRLMWGKAVRAGLVDSNPWKDVEVAPVHRTQVVPSAAEVDALADAARVRGWGRFADCIVFTAYSGLRLSEVADVKASDVREDGRRLLVRGKRRGGDPAPRERVVAVFAPGREALLRWLPEEEWRWVWLSPQGHKLTRATAGRCFRMCAADVGFLGTFHALRRFHASFLADRGADARDIAQQLGHVDRWGRPYPELVNRVYSHPSPEAALGRLEAVTG